MFINVIFPMQRYYIFWNYIFFLPRHADNPQTAITDFAPELMRTNIRDISKRVKHTKCVLPYTLGVSHHTHLVCRSHTLGVFLPTHPVCSTEGIYPFATSFSMVLPPVTKMHDFDAYFRHIYLKDRIMKSTKQE